MQPEINPFFDATTNTFSYVVADPETRHCAIIDAVLDFDPVSGRVFTDSADDIVAYVSEQKLVVDYVLETHVHADHLSAGAYLKQKLGGKTAIGIHVGEVQATFGPMFNADADFAVDGSQFDQLFDDGATFNVGALSFRVMHTPGHTPACITYIVGEAAFVGDTLFMPDYGTARTDFPGGDAGALYDSVQRILALPPETALYMCHDYLPDGRTEYAHLTTVAREREANVSLVGNDKAAFIKSRQARDKALAAPRLLYPSIQVNMRAGELPPAESNEMRYIKIPLRVDFA